MKTVVQLSNYLGAERKDREVFLRQVYRRYEGAKLDEPERFVDERLTPLALDRTPPDVVRRIREHREAGYTMILPTGVTRPLTRPFEGLFDYIIATDLATDADGVCTSFLIDPPMVGDFRAAWLTHYAGLYGIDLLASLAYADSHVDPPMLRFVGNPVVVSPDTGLMHVAKESGWLIIEWPPRALQPRRKLPL